MNDLFLGLPLVEWVGYLASAVVLFSFVNKDMVRLRIFNGIGCGLFVVYGLMLETSWPIVITNVCILLIHIVYLVRGQKTQAS